MDNKEMMFYEEAEGKGNIYSSELAAKTTKTNHPLVIISCPRSDGSRVQTTPKIVIQKPSNFSYKNDKMVPWNYGCNVTILEKRAERNQEIGSYTGNGKRYDAQAESSREENKKKEQKKGKAVEVEPLVNEPVKEEEAKEFLNSKAHRNALLKVLNETYIADDISVNKLDRLANNISADNLIFFSDDEIPSGRRGSTKALYVTARCKGYILPRILIDNGSALNVLPLSTLSRLPVDSSHMKACQSIVRAFDGTEKRVMGRIEVPLRIGPITYEVGFLVMEIKSSYNCLLGRPWIHSAGVVPSSLHQKVKIVSEGRVITISAEEDIITTVTGDAPYVEIDDEVVECSFRSTEMGLQLMIGRGASPGKGLGKYLQGKIETPVLKEKSEDIEEMLKNIHINAIETSEKRALLEICPYEPGSELNNWTAEEIPVVFRAYSE
ncbi:uncharacterized protein [Gossypium hirsutum]|uniref:Gag-pro-like protein n=1 Tax=Gossypium hirsutum TaxID=3635 RepID=A0A1U8L0Y0_GOSHI|nr:uncharacterized protein LOC107921715 [Gossypium hirsutum]